LEAGAFLVVVTFFAAAGFAAVFLLGAARVALSEAEDPSSESISTAEYWIFASLLWVERGTKKIGER
jgi:hypothetical protein